MAEENFLYKTEVWNANLNYFHKRTVVGSQLPDLDEEYTLSVDVTVNFYKKYDSTSGRVTKYFYELNIPNHVFTNINEPQKSKSYPSSKLYYESLSAGIEVQVPINISDYLVTELNLKLSPSVIKISSQEYPPPSSPQNTPQIPSPEEQQPTPEQPPSPLPTITPKKAKVVLTTSSPNVITKKFIAPEPEVEPVPTPEQVNAQTQSESDNSDLQQQVVDLSLSDSKTIEQNTPPDLKPQGGEKLATVLNKKRNDIKNTFIPVLASMALQLGIKNLGTPQIELPEVCIPQYELDALARKRNLLVNRLNNAVKITDSLTKITTGLSLTLASLNTLYKTLDISRKTQLASTLFLPKGVPGPLIYSLDKSRDRLAGDLNKNNLDDKIKKISSTLGIITLSVSTLNAVFVKITRMLKSTDLVLKACNQDPALELTPLSQTLVDLELANNRIESSNNQQSYNGFALEIETVPFSPTVNRRRAVAKNRNGIVLISTPLSFTTSDLVLIEALKLAIESDNLKAD